MVQAPSTEVVTDILATRAREHPDRLFWSVGDDHATYADAEARSTRVAAGLAGLGVRQGDRVAVLSTNRSEYLDTIYGLAKLGAIQVPLNAYLRGEFLRYQIEQSEATVAIADSAGIDALLAIRQHLTSLKIAVALDEPGSVDGLEIVRFAQLIASDQAAFVGPPISAADVFSIMYTSGTTGMPKGCMLPHGYYVHMGASVPTALPMGEDDVLYTALPLFHGAAQMLVTCALHNGVTVIIDPAFHVNSILDRWTEAGVTRFTAIGMMCAAMLQLPPSDKDRAHHVEFGVCTPTSPDLRRQFKERFGIHLNGALYGQTECVPVSLAAPSDTHMESAGKPAPHYDVAVVDDDDHALPSGHVGEIVVRPKAPNMMYVGYWRDPAATLRTWRNLWHHTGDYGKFDEDGYLYFVDRKKDALRRRGENISSVEVEAAILEHPQVLEAAVIAAPSDLGEDDVMACLVLSGEVPEPAQLFDYFKASMPYFMVPRYVRIMDALPKTPTNKVMKHVLRSESAASYTWDFDAMDLRIERHERR